jgi:hypothetical protein
LECREREREREREGEVGRNGERWRERWKEMERGAERGGKKWREVVEKQSSGLTFLLGKPVHRKLEHALRAARAFNEKIESCLAFFGCASCQLGH